MNNKDTVNALADFLLNTKYLYMFKEQIQCYKYSVYLGLFLLYVK